MLKGMFISPINGLYTFKIYKMQKLRLPFIIFCFITTIVNGQNCTSFQEAKEQGITMEKLDSTYTNAIHSDSTVYAIFRGQEDEFYNAYIEVLKELASYLKKNEYLWEKPTWCFHKIYFSKEGKIDYWLYNFRKGEITETKLKEFKILLNEFQKDFKFGLPAKDKFSQCGSATYKDN